MAGGISMHGVDVARGVPARGMKVELWMVAPESRLLGSGTLSEIGVWEDPVTRTDAIVAGTYEARFHAGAFFEASGSAPGILEVEDDGPGIPAAERDRVFERFYRSQQQGKGSGLGLAIVGEICRAHLAQISLHDGAAGGLKVRVSFVGG